MVIRTALTSALLCLATGAPAQEVPALFYVTGVASHDVLNIRAQPSALSEIVGVFSPGARLIEVIGLSDDGRWAWVRTPEGMGWAATRFLGPEPVAPWHEAQGPIECHGTEPFWSLTFDLPGQSATLRTPESRSYLLSSSPALPRTQFPRTLALPFIGERDGVAVVRAGACSNGMSDQMYGLEVQVYFMDDSSALSGCCQIGA